MRVTLLPVFATLAAAGACGAFVGIGTWDNAKTGLLTALSVICAAALVRLARGLPFTNSDHFEPEEVEAVTGAVQQLARALRAFLGIALGAMVLLVAAAPMSNLISRLWVNYAAKEGAERVVSALIGGVLAYVLVRIWQIVGSDLSLLEKQSTFMVRAVHRKARTKEEERDKALGAVPFKTPEGYGKQLQ